MFKHLFTPRSSGLSLAWISVLTIALIVAYAIIVPIALPEDQTTVNFANAYSPPSSDYWFGTDSGGHDLFVRTAQALRISLIIAVITAIFSAIIGTLIGVTAALAGGFLDRLTMRFVDGMNALPHLILVLVVVSLFKGSATAIVLALVATHWIPIARITRAQVLTMRHSDYIQAAYLGGRGHLWVIGHHLVPGALSQSVVGLVLLVPHAIWHESTLSFLGVGLPAHRTALGTLLRDAQGGVLLGSWWILVFPALFLVVFCLAVSHVGHSLVSVVNDYGEGRV